MDKSWKLPDIESELIWDVIAGETQISLQVDDNRLFAGCWNYATICYWGVGENGSAVDLIIWPV